MRVDLAGKRVVASVSGGKDSAAMSLWLTEQGIEHDRVFLDTGWEHPLTYEHIRGELTRKLGPITEVRGPLSMEELVRKKGMFPSRLRRFCTQELKVFPMIRYLADLRHDGVPLVNAVGIRGSESEQRSKLFEWEWSDDFACDIWRPLIAWSEQDVIDIHRRHEVRPNPLYLMGASRVGCWPCIYARKAEVRLVADVDPGRIDRIREIEEELTQRAGAPRAWFHSSSAAQASFVDQTQHEFPPLPIDAAVEWSRTGKGGRQAELFVEEREPGCFRWGLCDTEAA